MIGCVGGALRSTQAGTACCLVSGSRHGFIAQNTYNSRARAVVVRARDPPRGRSESSSRQWVGAKSAALDDAALTEREPSCASPSPSRSRSPPSSRRLQHQQQRNVRREKATYQVAAIAASSFVVASAVVATYLRISQHLDDTHPFPYVDLLSTCLLAVGGMVGMEMYARVVHRWAWHEFVPGWSIHRSHHEPRTGAFELNDLYAIVRIELDRRAPRLDGSALALLCSCALVLLCSCALVLSLARRAAVFVRLFAR